MPIWPAYCTQVVKDSKTLSLFGLLSLLVFKDWKTLSLLGLLSLLVFKKLKDPKDTKWVFLVF